MENIPELRVALIPNDRLEETEYKTVAVIGDRWEFLGERDLYRFLILEDGTFIVGPVSNHVALWLLHTGQGSLRENPKLLGAGVIDQCGLISSWESLLFGKETPKDLREPVEDLLERIIADGTLPLPPQK